MGAEMLGPLRAPSQPCGSYDFPAHCIPLWDGGAAIRFALEAGAVILLKLRGVFFQGKPCPTEIAADHRVPYRPSQPDG